MKIRLRLYQLPVLMLLTGAAWGQTSTTSGRAVDDTATPNTAKAATETLPRVLVTGPYVTETKRAHLLPEINGTTITVTKKNSIAMLDQQSTVVDGNLRELFQALPGLQIAEQQTPIRVNMNYRGIGNPQESEYLLSLQDGIPIVSDWIGYPTLYYLPPTASLESIQFIRGGASLLYGPEPGGVINYVSRKPVADREFSARSENIFGSHNLFTTYDEVSGTSGQWEYLADLNYRHSNGERSNGGYNVTAVDAHVGYRFSTTQKLMLDVHTYSARVGSAGNMFYPQFVADARLATTPFNRVWVDRSTAILTYDGKFGDKTTVTSKLWVGYQDLAQRTAAAFVPPAAPPATTTLDDQKFQYAGIDTRMKYEWTRGSALTAGFVYYSSTSPWRQDVSANLSIDRDDGSGTPRLRQDRSSKYSAVFVENVFRYGKLHFVPSARYEHEEIAINATLMPGTNPLLNRSFKRNVPLLGFGFGNDFGVGHETYVNISQGFRPLRYLDVANAGGTLSPTNNPDPSKSTSYEAGVHGWPVKGFYYDVGLFEVDVKNRIESQSLSPTVVANVNSGDTRHRGLELEGSWDLWAQDARAGAGQHLTVFSNLTWLDAVFTASSIVGRVGLRPAFAPRYVARAGISWSSDKQFKLSLSGVAVARQYWQDSNQPSGTGASFIPAEIPQYKVFDCAAEYSLNNSVKLLGGISNLTDKKYYSRVFSGIEPANRRAAYLGAALYF